MGKYSLSNISAALEHKLQLGLATLAEKCARKPKTTIALVLLCIFACASGFTQLHIETKGDRLWVPQDSRPKVAQRFIEANYAVSARSENVIIGSTPSGSNVLTLERVRQALGLHTAIMAIETANGNTFADLCAKTASGSCITGGLPRFWGAKNLTYIDPLIPTEAALLSTLSATNFASPDGAPVARHAIFGHSTAASDGSLATAEFLKMRYFLVGEFDGSLDEPLAWETELVKIVTENPAGDDRSQIVATVQSFRSIDDELARTVGGDIPLFAGTFTVMVVFCCVVLGRPGQMRSGLAMAGTGLVFLSMLGSYGLAMWMGATFTTLAQVLPFVLLGIGLDDILILQNTFMLTDRSLPIDRRLGITMHRCGPSITLTSATNAMAFVLGTSSTLPAVSWFCVYASLGVLVDYFVQITAFVACMAMDERRVLDGRMDMLCCIRSKSHTRKTAGDREPRPPAAGPAVSDTEAGKPEEPTLVEKAVAAASEAAAPGAKQPESDSRLRVFFRDYYGPLLMRTPVKVAVVLLFAGLTATCAWGLSEVGTGFDLIDLTPDESYLRDYFNMEKEGWPTGGGMGVLPVDVYFKEIPYETATTQRQIAALRTAIQASEYIQGPTTSWFDDFATWAASQPSYAGQLTSDGFFDETTGFQGSQYQAAVCQFLSQPAFKRYAHDIVFYQNGAKMATQDCATAHSIGTSRFETMFRPLGDSVEQADAMVAMWALTDASPITPAPMSFTVPYAFFEQYRIIFSQLLQNFAVSLVAVGLLCVIFLVKPAAALVVTGIVAVIDLDLTGSLFFYGLEVNALTVVNLIMSIGLTVDYSAHLMHSLMQQDPKKSAADRVVDALAEMGPGVLLGALSTFVGIAPLGLASSEVFRVFFRCFLVIILYGAGHGLIFMPVVMSWWAPKPLTDDKVSFDRSASKKFSFNVGTPTTQVRADGNKQLGSTGDVVSATPSAVELTTMPGDAV